MGNQQGLGIAALEFTLGTEQGRAGHLVRINLFRARSTGTWRPQIEFRRDAERCNGDGAELVRRDLAAAKAPLDCGTARQGERGRGSG
jgi:hypothetical protein